MIPQRKSCVSKLHQMQRSFGLSDRELKQAVVDVARPREVKLPTFHEKISKREKMRQKLEKPAAKKRKSVLAHWYLEEYLDSAAAYEVYKKFPKFKDLIDYSYEMAMGVIQLGTYVIDGLDPLDAFPETPEDNLDIPEVQWREFDAYCEKHPLKNGASDIFSRRERFKKYLKKRRRKYYNKKSMRMYDPLFAMSVVNEKEMIRNLERITRENELRVKKFHEMLDALVEDKSIGAEAMKKFDKQTSDIIASHKKRLDSFMKNLDHKPASITFEFDDSSITYK